MNCACTQNCWFVKQINPDQGIIECSQCQTKILFTLEMIEYSV